MSYELLINETIDEVVIRAGEQRATTIHASSDGITFTTSAPQMSDSTPWVRLPVSMLISAGILSEESLQGALNKRGSYPIEGHIDRQLGVYMYYDAADQELFLLKHEVRADGLVAPSPSDDDGFSSIPVEDPRQGFGKKLRLSKGALEIIGETVLVPRRTKLVQIPLELLLDAQIVSLDALKSLMKLKATQ